MSKELLTSEDFRALLASFVDLTNPTGPQEVLDAILDRACHLTDSQGGSLILFNEQRQTLYFAAATGPAGAELVHKLGHNSSEQVPIEHSIAGTVLKTLQPVVSNDMKKEKAHSKVAEEATSEVTDSMVCVPLMEEDHCVGVLQLINKGTGPYTDRDVEILRLFSCQSGLVLKRARDLAQLIAYRGLYVGKGSPLSLGEMLEELDAPMRQEELTLAFIDMRGFSQLCQRLIRPDRIQRVLNDFLGLVARAVTDGGGVVNKFLGDGAFAFFRGDNKEVRAVRSAFAILNAFDQHKERWQEIQNEHIGFLDVGIGLVTDDVYLGSVGSAPIKDYTAVGTPVNLASAFESNARRTVRLKEGTSDQEVDVIRVICDSRTWRESQQIIGKSKALGLYELKKPDQEKGIDFPHYWLEELKAAEVARIFVSYAREDFEIVSQSVIAPLERSGVSVWWDAEIPAGSNWVEELGEAFQRCRGMIVVVSKASIGSKWVRDEVNLALTSHFQHRILPVCLDESSPESLNYFLKARQRVVVDGSEASDHLAKIVQTWSI